MLLDLLPLYQPPGGGAAPQPLYWGRDEDLRGDDLARRQEDELILALLGAL